MENLQKRLQQYANDTLDGLKQFSEHPIKYPARALKEIVEDYWDLALAAASGLAIVYYGKDKDSIDLQSFLVGLSPLASMAAGYVMHLKERDKAIVRSARNAGAVIGTMAITVGVSDLDKNKILSIAYLLEGLGGLGYSGYAEFVRRQLPKIGTTPLNTGTLENHI